LLLNAKLALHEVDDVEGVCISAIRKAGLRLEHYEFEECLTYLIETSWELSLGYERGDFPSRFGVYLSRRLQQRLSDWQRSRNGRTKWQFADRVYTRSLPSFVPLEHRPDGLDHSILGNPDPGGLPDLLGLQRARGSKGARSAEEASGAAA